MIIRFWCAPLNRKRWIDCRNPINLELESSFIPCRTNDAEPIVLPLQRVKFACLGRSANIIMTNRQPPCRRNGPAQIPVNTIHPVIRAGMVNLDPDRPGERGCPRIPHTRMACVRFACLPSSVHSSSVYKLRKRLCHGPSTAE